MTQTPGTSTSPSSTSGTSQQSQPTGATQFGGASDSSHTLHDGDHRDERGHDDDRMSAADAAMECFRTYSRERPEAAALWALGIGFVLGWKLKPW